MEKNKNLDKLDKILTAEGKDLDKEGTHNEVLGVYEELLSSNRFAAVKIIDSVDVRSATLGVFPSELPLNTIEKICKENNVDAIFALSFYDTDAQIDYKAVPVEIQGPLGISIPEIEHHVTVRTLIKTGWRIYDPYKKDILDEYLINENVVNSGVGINPVNAIEALTGRKESVLHVSSNIGHDYAARIFPYKIRVSRRYYVRGTINFQISKRKAQTGDWDGAAVLWEQ